MRRPCDGAVVLWFRAAGHVPAVMVGQLLLKEWEMPPARTFGTLSAIVLWMAACVAAGLSGGVWPIVSSAAAERDGVGDPPPVQLGAETTRDQAKNQAKNQARNLSLIHI